MKAKVAILALVTEAFGGSGGIAQYNRDFLGALAFSGLVSQIIVLPRTAHGWSGLCSAGIEQAPSRSGRFAYTIAALRMALARSVDIVFCGHLYMAPLAMVIARLKGAKLVVQTHGIEAWPQPPRLLRAALEAADLVLCVSRHTRARVLSGAAVTPERAVVLPNTVGEEFSPGPSTLRATLGLESKYVLLTVARLDTRERYKGHDRVIAAMPRLLTEAHDVAYVVVGDGDDLIRLQVLADEAGVADRVRFLGNINPETLRDVYRTADLFVMPSTGEGFGIAYLEAMASGTPALGLSVAGACDALGDGELGIAVTKSEFLGAIERELAAPKTDPLALAAAVRARFGREVFRARVVTIFNNFLALT